MASVIFEEQLELPLTIRSYADFRKWAVSEDFPEVGRIDFVGGNIEVDMSPEEMYSHNAVRIEISRVLANTNKARRLGELYSDGIRISSDTASLSAEPDLLFFSQATLNSDRVRLIPKSGKEDFFIEAEGGPDMVAEIVRDASVLKDTRRLPLAYYQAGVQEYWLIDARKDPLVFKIHVRGASEFVPQLADGNGYLLSQVFGESFRLERQRDERGRWEYEFLSIPAESS